MALGSGFENLCPLFDFNNSGGVLLPYFPMTLGQAPSNSKYINLDGSVSAVHARFRVPMAATLITCEAFAVSDDQGVKTAGATAEPVLGIVAGTYPLASIDAGTSIAIITCDLSGPIGKKWVGTTTQTAIATTDEIIVHLHTAAAGTVSGVQDGGAVPVLWFAATNAPA